ncbi:MAG: chromosomal replication initiator protein DnaA [Betaproteobacteria bacterium]|nr:chromosomal replication initiator protein DnaA [Betaproteobacteria bacterium]
MSAFWDTCLDKLKEELPPKRFAVWIAPLFMEGEKTPDEGLCLVAPSNFICNWVRQHYLDFIQDYAADFYDRPVNVRLEIRQPDKKQAGQPENPGKQEKAAPSGAKHKSATAEQNEQKLLHERTRLNQNQFFENLVIGKANNLAYAAAENVAEKPGGSLYNPLFIYGGPGLGKTHLMHAIGNRIIQQYSDKVVRYVHAEDYCNDVMRAYRQGAFVDMKNYYRSLDVLLLDDVQFFGVGDKSRTKEEFFFVFNALVEAGKQIVITCDTYPKDINGLDGRLVSRFDWGLTVQIEPPETEMRVAILQKKAEAESLSLSNEVAFFIAKSLRANVRELEGALKKVIAYANFRNSPITLDLAREALKELISSTRNISIEEIQKTVAGYYKVKLADLLSKKRSRSIARPRQVAMWLCKEVTPCSYPMIGEAFGGRDHTTVIHAFRTIEEIKTQDNTLKHDLHVLTQCFKG